MVFRCSRVFPPKVECFFHRASTIPARRTRVQSRASITQARSLTSHPRRTPPKSQSPRLCRSHPSPPLLRHQSCDPLRRRRRRTRGEGRPSSPGSTRSPSCSMPAWASPVAMSRLSSRRPASTSGRPRALLRAHVRRRRRVPSQSDPHCWQDLRPRRALRPSVAFAVKATAGKLPPGKGGAPPCVAGSAAKPLHHAATAFTPSCAATAAAPPCADAARHGGRWRRVHTPLALLWRGYTVHATLQNTGARAHHFHGDSSLRSEQRSGSSLVRACLV